MAVEYQVGHRFTNWGRNLECRPPFYCEPSGNEDIVEVIKHANSARRCVRPQGARKSNSWSSLVLTNGALVNLEELKAITAVKERQATMQAGIRIKHLTKQLSDRHRLGLENLGSIQEQSIAGAIATGTHGTGIGLGNLSTQVERLKLVSGGGEVLTLTRGDKDYFHAASLSLGALGILTEVTLRCVEDYRLENTNYLWRLDELVKNLDTLIRSNTRVRIWWFVPPVHERDVVISTMNPPGTGGIPGALTKLLTGFAEPLPMDARELRQLARRATNPNDTTTCLRLGSYEAHYTKVLTIPMGLIPRHVKCEYAIPVEKTVDALEHIAAKIKEGWLELPLPLEIRFIANDSQFLSPAYHPDGFKGPGMCCISAGVVANGADAGANEVLRRFEQLMKQLGGRPHWGKRFTLTKSEARRLFPAFDRFNEIRKEFDRNGVFANTLIRQLFD